MTQSDLDHHLRVIETATKGSDRDKVLLSLCKLVTYLMKEKTNDGK